MPYDPVQYAANKAVLNARRRARRKANPELAHTRDRASREKLRAMTEFKHGVGGYFHHSCRCDVCICAYRARPKSGKFIRTPEQKARRKANRKVEMPTTFKSHGTWSAYASGCRCPICRAFKHEAKRRSAKKHPRSYNYRRAAKDPAFRVQRSLSCRLLKELRRGSARKDAKTMELIGCTRAELRSRLASKFQPGMSWNNHGTAWHVDHIQPCASFDLRDPEQQRLCFHYSNLQPLWAEINSSKSDSLWSPEDLAYATAMTPYPS